MAASARCVIAFCVAALAVGLSGASTIPPTPQSVQQQETQSSSLPHVNAVGGFGVVGVAVAGDDDAASTTEAAPTTTEAAPVTEAAPTTVPVAAVVAVTEADTTTTSDDAATTTEAVTTSTTPALPQPPFDCYDCNSGSPLPGYWNNQNCGATGYVAQWYVPTTCNTYCFSSVGLYPAGSVFRGCASSLYLGGRVLEQGCFEDPANNRHVCLCAGHHCNTHDLSNLSALYAQEYINMQQQASTQSNAV